MTLPAVSYKNHRFPPHVIANAVWLYYRFPLSLRLVEEMLLERGIVVSYETIRRWGRKFGPDYVRRLRRKQPSPNDVWHLDEVVISIAGRKHWLWRAVDQDGCSVANFRVVIGAQGTAAISCGGEDFELLCKRRIWIEGVSRLSFAHHVHHFDAGQRDLSALFEI